MPTIPGSFAVMSGADPFRNQSDGQGNALAKGIDWQAEMRKINPNWTTAGGPEQAPSYAIGRPDYNPQDNLGMGSTMPQPMAQAPQAMQQQQPAAYAQPQQPQGAPGPANGGGNPYLGMQAGAIGQQMSDNLNRNFMPQLGMASMAAGGYGGSAQGVVQANAMKDMNLGLGSALGNLYGNDWNNTQNRNLQRYQGDQSFYTERGQDQSGAALGANLMAQGQAGQWGPLQGASSVYSPYTGLGTNTTSGQTGGGANGALGGAMAGGILSKYMGGGSTGSTGSTAGAYGVGNPNNMFNGVNTNGWWS